jgi:hypothetical protein
MDKLIETNALEVVDLGVASIETKGFPGLTQEPVGGQDEPGLTAQD